MIMKKFSIILIASIVFIIGACENQEKVFPDYDYTAVYFPIQFPVRTLSLGEDRVDNSLDRELKFHIGTVIGGMYANKWDWQVNFELAPSLAENVSTSTGMAIKMLPPEYYTMTPSNSVTIPNGKLNGLIQIQLKDEFLDDPLAIGHHYVIPLRIISTTADSILTGLPAISNPDKRVASHWDANAMPRDFTLFMIKYVNPFHGYYLRRGVTYKLNAAGEKVDTVVYRNQFVERDQVVSLTTKGRNKVHAGFTGTDFGFGFGLNLTIEESGVVQIDSVAGERSAGYGFGESRYLKNGERWGGLNHDAMYLQYRYFDRNRVRYEVFDTIVFRDRGLKFEEFIPVVEGIEGEK